MNRINPLLESDYYKQVHWNQYPKNVAKVVSYFTPRMSRLNGIKHIVMFGLQSFIKEYLIKYNLILLNKYLCVNKKREINILSFEKNELALNKY